jgi:hypothetical protein
VATLLDLAKRIEKIEKTSLERANRAKKAVAEEVLLNLIVDTPVDTGEHVANWLVGLGSAPGGPIPPYSEGEAGSTGETNRMRALNAGQRQIRTAKPGVPIYISNSAPAIRMLNDGASDQAPAGFIERAIVVGRKAAQRFRN